MTIPSLRISVCALALTTATFVMCSSPPRTTVATTVTAEAAQPTPAARTTNGTTRVSAPIEVAPTAGASREELAFREERGALLAESSRYAARVDGGAIRIVNGLRPEAQRTRIRAAEGGARLTTSIARGDAALSTDHDAARIVNGGVVIPRHGVVEQVRPTTDGIEQAWDFAAPPEGRGDLVVRVRVDGTTYVASDARGTHFADAETHARLVYGAATWVDARGARTAILATYDRGAITLRVDAKLLATSAYPASLDPLVGPEVALDAPRWSSNYGIGTTAVTYDGAHYVAASTTPIAPAITVRRLDPSTGQPLGSPASSAETEGTVVSGSGVAQAPFVGCDASRKCLVVWSETRSPSTAVLLYGALYDANAGALLTPFGGVAILASGTSQTARGVAFDGTNFAVAWQETGGATPGTYLARIGDGGASPSVLDTHFIVASSDAAIAYGAGTYLVATNEGGALRERRVDPSTGIAIADSGAPFTLASSNVAAFGVTFAAGAFDIAWIPYTTTFGLSAIRVDPTNGAPLGSTATNPPGGPTNATLFSSYPGYTFLLYNGASVLAIYGGSFETCYGYECGTSPRFYITTLDPLSGAFVGTAQLYSNVMSEEPANDPVTSGASVLNGTALLTSANDDFLTSQTAGEVNSILTVVPYGISALTPDTETAPVVAVDSANDSSSDAPNYFVLFNDNVGGVRGVRFDPTTQMPIDATSFGLEDVDGPPSVAFDGTTFLFAEDVPQYGSSGSPDELGPFTQTFNPATLGTATGIDFDSVATGSPTSTTSIASDGNRFYLVWAQGNLVLGARIDPASGGLVAGESIHTLGANAIGGRAYAPIANPAVGFDGTNYFVVWTGSVDGPGGTFTTKVLGVRVNPATGAPLAADGSGVVLCASTTPAVAAPALAYANGHFLVAWVDYRADSNGQVYGAIVDPEPAATSDGGAQPVTKLGADIAISVAAGSAPSGIHVVNPGDATNYQVVWQDRRNPTLDVYGSIVSYAGVVGDPEGLPIAADPNFDDVGTSTASSGGGTSVVAYQHYDYALGVTRAYVRFVSTGVAQATACMQNEDCTSRLCVDGYCCDTACDGPCETCSAPGHVGTCTPVTSAPDPDTCAATCANDAASCQAQSSCSASGACVLANGQGATSAAACLSGFVADFVCCDQACTGGCATCTAPGHVGTCTPLVAGSNGVNGACVSDGGGIYCDGKGLTCPGTCADDHDCPAGFCNASHACQTPVMKKDACNLATDCATPGACAECAAETTCAIAACDADAGSASVVAATGAGTCTPTVNLETTSCGGFGCDGNVCKTSCSANTDCAAGFSCEASDSGNSKCVAAAVCADSHTAQDVNGNTTECSPYVCSAGACLQKCSTIGDCTGGFICGTNGTCVLSSTIGGGSSGCSCRTSTKTGSGGAWLAFVALGIAIRRRRRGGFRDGREAPGTASTGSG